MFARIAGTRQRGTCRLPCYRSFGVRHGLVLVACLPWLVLLGWLAETAWFLTDDAFISFRYARNLLEGHGLVFNPGERVEGYSNFLWVLELAFLWGAFGLRPEHAAPWLSAAFTAGTLAAMAWWVARLPALRQRGLVAWMALGLVCASATFAVWTSGGGLETRQFTFFVVFAVACLVRPGGRALLAAASLSLAAASLTRPEGPLLAACCFAWHGAQRRLETGRWLGMEWAWLAAPCAAVVVGHYLFRHGYYGEWLPNTYYAKFVRPWYEMGLRYLAAAALETGLYLLGPLALAALAAGWRRRRSLAHALPPLCIGVHMVYMARVGGDHFEYRPLDFYWPLLAVPAAAGIAVSARALAAAFKRLLRWRSMQRDGRWTRLPAAGALAGALFGLVLLYASGLQAALLFEGAKVDEHIFRLKTSLDAENAGWLLAIPGMPILNVAAERLRFQLVSHGVGVRFPEHREFAALKLQCWQPYQEMERGLIPADAVAAMGTIGVAAFYLPDLTLVDQHGLTDATVARNPVVRSNHSRYLAHDRRPPEGYLQARGVNFDVYPARRVEWPGYWGARYALEPSPGLWMPFNAIDDRWVADRFDPARLSDYADPKVANRNTLIYKNEYYVGDRLLLQFEDGVANWQLEGDVFTRSHQRVPPERRVGARVGQHVLSTFHPTDGDLGVGRAWSPPFTAKPDELLSLRIARRHQGARLRLLADDAQVDSWRGYASPWFRRIDRPLVDVAGKRLQLELFDSETSGHVLLNQVLVMRPAGPLKPEPARRHGPSDSPGHVTTPETCV